MNIDKVLKKALGGILFIDEAYALTGENETIEKLLLIMEEHKDDLIIIFAGYLKEMFVFLESNPGLASRIGYTFHFPDYSVPELTEMYISKMEDCGFTISDEACDSVTHIMEYFSESHNFGNGRFVERLIDQTITKRSQRNFKKMYRDIGKKDIPAITELIESSPGGKLRKLQAPEFRTNESLMRTAIHETGHALVSYLLEPTLEIKRVTISANTFSEGRTEFVPKYGNHTESQCHHQISVFLGGRNAERILLREHATGCSMDYDTAKKLAHDMVNTYAMGDICITTETQILHDADQKTTELLIKNKDVLQKLSEVLLKKKDLSGKEFIKLYKKYRKPEIMKV